MKDAFCRTPHLLQVMTMTGFTQCTGFRITSVRISMNLCTEQMVKA